MKHVVLILFVIHVGFYSSWSQELESTMRPKVGLALSGGAAHGFAHIGVLQYLEEQGIEIDYITGTSMGSVIGGLYALGFNARDIKHIASQLDWDVIMSNSIPLNEVAPIEKPFHGKIPLSILWKGSAFKLPQGLIRGQKLDLVISHVYCPAYSVTDFDNFHIPFRCVGVDIENGSMNLFNDGYLGNSIRASMAIPTVFPPKELNDRLYVDGGLIRNFPVQEVMDMGADFTIGVYVGSEKESREDLVSMLDILRQATSMSSILDSEKQAKLADILVLPEVKKMGSFDFNNYEEFIQKGYEAAKVNAEKVRNLAKTLNQFPTLDKNKKLKYPKSLRFSKITTLDSDPVFEKMILNELRIWENYAVTLDQIDERLSLIYGTKNFSKAAYTFNNTKQGLELIIDVDEIAPFSLGFNVNRFNLYNTAFVLSGEARNVIGKPSNFRMDARISDNPGLQGQYFLRLPRIPSLLVKLSAKLERFELPQFVGDQQSQLYKYEQGYLRAELVQEWKNRFLFSLGFQFLHDEIKPDISEQRRFLEYQSERNEVFAELSLNNLDKQNYATKGSNLEFGIKYMFNNLIEEIPVAGIPVNFFSDEKSYAAADFSFLHYKSLSSILCLELGIQSRYALGKSFLDSYKIGGPRQAKTATYGFMGLDDSELIVGNHISGSLALRMQLMDNLYLSPAASFIYAEQYDFVSTQVVSILGVGLAIDYNAPIGPVSFNIGYADLKDQVIMNLGLGYRHIF